MYEYLNLNPMNLKTGDCVIRAIANSLNQSWEDTYIGVCRKGLQLFRMPTDNGVWGAYLHDRGFEKGTVENMCPTCYTVRDFAFDNPTGGYVLGTGSHAVSLIHGTYYDTWDSGDEVVSYYLKER